MQPPQDLVTRDDSDLLEILHDFAAAELRSAELAIPEGVWHLDDRLRLRAGDDLKPDLEADGVQVHAVDRGAAQREEPARRVPHRNKDVADEARDPRDHAAPERPVHRRAAPAVTAADGADGPMLDAFPDASDRR